MLHRRDAMIRLGQVGVGAPTLPTTTRHGNKLAVDPAPHPAGNQAVYRDATGTWASRSLTSHAALPPAPWEHTYMPHVATCARPAPLQPELPGITQALRPPRRPARPRRAPRTRRRIQPPTAALF